MKITPMECPKCGGKIQPAEGQKDLYCQYCGTRLHIDDDQISINITYKGEQTTIIRDEAKLKEIKESSKLAKTEQKLLKSKIRAERFANTMHLMRILLVVLYTASWALLFEVVDLVDREKIPKDVGPYYLMYLIVFGIALFVTRKKKN